MAQSIGATQAKRKREQLKRERKEEKRAKRALRAEQKKIAASELPIEGPPSDSTVSGGSEHIT